MSGEAENTVDYVEDAKHPMAPVRAKLKGGHMATAKPAPAQESLVPLKGDPNGDAIPAISVATPVDLLRIAVTQGADIDKLEKLMALQERWEKNEARKAFVAAMNKFKANPPVISKNKHVHFETSKGPNDYDHATLDHVCDVVTKGLSAVGITHAWKVKQDKDVISVTCVLTHELGHSEEYTLSGLPDNTGSKNAIQAIASACTYLQRYTLLMGTGQAPKGADNDGHGAGQSAVDPAKLEEYCRQLTEVETLADLKTVFARAYGEAQTLNDRKAMASYIQAKDKRKKEIENAAR
jgi:hypothetical protein